MRKAWLERFAVLNEELANGVSVADLLYVTQCYLRVLQRKITPPSPDRLPSLMTELRILACNNTVKTRQHEPDPEAFSRIQDECSAFIVFHFSHANRRKLMERLPATVSLSKELEEQVHEARSLHFQQPAKDAVKDGTLVTSPDSVDQQQTGFFWAISMEAVLRNFVGFASRVTHSIEYDSYFLERTYTRGVPDMQSVIATAERRNKLHSWVEKQAGVEQSSEFMVDFRKLVFEESMPRNCLYASNSRKSARVNKSTAVDSLLQDECGFLALNRLAVLTSESLSTLAASETHELHSCLLLLLFHYRFHHATKKKFIHQFYVTRQRLCQSESIQEFCTKVKWGMNQRPVIVQLKKQLCVLDISGPDVFARGSAEEKGKRIECVLCVDMYDALLYWIHLMATKYNHELICATRVRSVYEPFV